MPSYVVAGASRGIGIAFLRKLSSNPENIVFGLVRNKTTAKDALALEQTHPNLHILQADITDFEALKVAAAKVSSFTGGKLNYLINNAAIRVTEDRRDDSSVDSYPMEHVEEDVLFCVKTNVVGVINTINAFIPLLEAAAADSVVKVVTLSSGMADTDLVMNFGVTMNVPYAISKAALNMAIAKYASKYKGTNLGFLAISPGLVDTSTRPPTPEEIKGYEVMIKSFKSAYPDFTGAITPEVSVNMMMDVIEHWDVKKENGAFVSHHGNKAWL